MFCTRETTKRSYADRSSSIGMIPPIYYTAMKCRVPSVRRKAVALLELAPHREGMWDGALVATVAGKVSEMEEDGFYGDFEPSFDRPEEVEMPTLPECQRFEEVKVVMSEKGDGRGRLICKRRRNQEYGAWEIKEEEFMSNSSPVH